MRPLELDDNEEPTENYKPGQLGFGGDWYSDLFGYSNWMEYTVVEGASVFGKQDGWSRGGDVNLRLEPIPVPAGLPLILTGLAGLYAMKRRKTAA